MQDVDETFDSAREEEEERQYQREYDDTEDFIAKIDMKMKSIQSGSSSLLKAIVAGSKSKRKLQQEETSDDAEEEERVEGQDMLALVRMDESDHDCDAVEPPLKRSARLSKYYPV